MPTLTQKNHDALFERGISTHKGFYEHTIHLTPKGMYWILNFINIKNPTNPKLSLAFLKEIADFNPQKTELRALNYTATRLNVYDDKIYYQLQFYLDGTPPRCITTFPPDILNIPTSFDISSTRNSRFETNKDYLTFITFSENEITNLENGEFLKIKL